jgi:hypothetical protein
MILLWGFFGFKFRVRGFFGPQSIWNQWPWDQKLILMQSVPITTDVSSNLDLGEVYSLQHYEYRLMWDF